MLKKVLILLLLLLFFVVKLAVAQHPMNTSIACKGLGEPCSDSNCCSGLVCCSGICQTSCGPTPPPSGPGPSGPISPAIVKSMDIVECPEEINASLGETKLFGVSVKNNGTVALNVSLSVSGVPFFVKVSPETAEMGKNTTKVFLVRVEVPNQTEFVEYSMLVKATGDNITVSRTIKLKIIEKVDLESLLRAEIKEIEELIEKVWREAIELGIRGYDVSKVFEILIEARNNTQAAKDYVNSKNYAEAEKQIDEARNNLEQAVIELSQVKLKRVEIFQIVIPFWVQVLLLVAIIALIVLYITFYRMRRLVRRLEDYIWKRLEEKWTRGEKEPPLCRKCLTRHWPFQPCPTEEKKA